MILHHKTDKGKHSYMLKFWPNKGLTFVKVSKEAQPKKRPREEVDVKAQDNWKPSAWGKGTETGGKGGHGHTKGWGADTRGSPAQAPKESWPGWKEYTKDPDRVKKMVPQYDNEGKRCDWT